jgi:hypothetical protein
MRREPPLDPFGILGIGNPERRWRRIGEAQPSAGFLGSLAARGDDIRRQAVERAFAALHHQRIQIDQMTNPLRHRIGDPADRQTAEGMTDQNDVVQFLGLDDVDDVLGENIQRDVFRQQVLAFAKSGLGWREHPVAAGAQPVRDPAPAPAAMPGSVHQHEGLGRGLRRRRTITRTCRQSCKRHCFEDVPTLHDRCSLCAS